MTLLVNAYGQSSARIAVNELTKGTLASYSIEDDNTAIDVSVTSGSYSYCRYSIVSFYDAKLPTITEI